MNKKETVCDSCGFYFNEALIFENKDGKSYCHGCRKKIINTPLEKRPLSQEDFDKLLKSLWHTPPLKLKDLKEQLKKEREKKKRGAKRKKVLNN